MQSACINAVNLVGRFIRYMVYKFSITIIAAMSFAGLGNAQNCSDSFPASLFQNSSFEVHGTCNIAWRGEGGLIDGNTTAVYIAVDGWHAANTDNNPRYL